MSRKASAFYYREQYYLLPDEFDSVDNFKASLPATVRLKILTEDNEVNSMLEKGVCIAPYFYSEYGYKEEDVLIESADGVYPVDAELFTQKEYNDRIRDVILSYCPGCQGYKPISNKVQSLNGHFEEISLNSVCFYRQNYKPAPRVFREYLFGIGGLWRNFDPAGTPASRLADEFKSILHIKYDAAEKTGPEKMTLKFKPDFFTQILTEILENYIEKTLTFTKFRLEFDKTAATDKGVFDTQISENNTENFRKNCKKYGVSLAVMTYDPAFEEQVNRSLAPLFEHYKAQIICREPGALYLMLLDQCGFLKDLHFRSPLLSSAGCEITVYDQYEKTKDRVSFDMQKI